MILTHFLALVAVPTLAIDPAPALLPLVNSQPLIGDAGQGQALAPALRARALNTKPDS
jgi:hypothetical protein